MRDGTRLQLDQVEYLPKWPSIAFVNPALEKWLDTNKVSSLTLAGFNARTGDIPWARKQLLHIFDPYAKTFSLTESPP